MQRNISVTHLCPTIPPLCFHYSPHAVIPLIRRHIIPDEKLMLLLKTGPGAGPIISIRKWESCRGCTEEGEGCKIAPSSVSAGLLPKQVGVNPTSSLLFSILKTCITISPIRFCNSASPWLERSTRREQGKDLWYLYPEGARSNLISPPISMSNVLYLFDGNHEFRDLLGSCSLSHVTHSQDRTGWATKM